MAMFSSMVAVRRKFLTFARHRTSKCQMDYSLIYAVDGNMNDITAKTTRKITDLNIAYVEIKCQLDATEVFIADLIACSTCFGHHYVHHQELKSIIQWLLPVVFRAVVFKLLVWCGAEGYVSG